MAKTQQPKAITVESATVVKTPAEPTATLADCTTALRLACIAVETPEQPFIHAGLADHRAAIDRVLTALAIHGLEWGWVRHGTAGDLYPVLKCVWHPKAGGQAPDGVDTGQAHVSGEGT